MNEGEQINLEITNRQRKQFTQIIQNLPNGKLKVFKIAEIREDPTNGLVTIEITGETTEQ